MTAGDRNPGTTGHTLPDELGPVLSRHYVDNDRRRLIGGWGLAMAAAGGILSAIMLLGEESPGPYQPGQGQAQGAVIGLTLTAFVTGAVFLWKALRGGADEHFELREGGLVYASARSIRAYPWDCVAYVRIRKAPGANPVSHYFGSQYWGSIALKDCRRRLKFNGLTDRYSVLGAALMANCASAPRTTGRQRLFWLGLGLASSATFAFLIHYINTHPDTEREIDHGSSTEVVNVPGISDTAIYVIVTGLVVTAVLVIVSFVMFWRKD
jgi:hypothetical protein